MNDVVSQGPFPLYSKKNLQDDQSMTRKLYISGTEKRVPIEVHQEVHSVDIERSVILMR